MIYNDIIREWDDYLADLNRRAKMLFEEEQDTLPVRSRRAHDDAGQAMALARNFRARHIEGDIEKEGKPYSRSEAEANRQKIHKHISDLSKRHLDLSGAHMDDGNIKQSTGHIKQHVDLNRMAGTISKPLK